MYITFFSAGAIFCYLKLIQRHNVGTIVFFLINFLCWWNWNNTNFFFCNWILVFDMKPHNSPWNSTQQKTTDIHCTFCQNTRHMHHKITSLYMSNKGLLYLIHMSCEWEFNFRNMAAFSEKSKIMNKFSFPVNFGVPPGFCEWGKKKNVYRWYVSHVCCNMSRNGYTNLWVFLFIQ